MDGNVAMEMAIIHKILYSFHLTTIIKVGTLVVIKIAFYLVSNTSPVISLIWELHVNPKEDPASSKRPAQHVSHLRKKGKWKDLFLSVYKGIAREFIQNNSGLV